MTEEEMLTLPAAPAPVRKGLETWKLILMLCLFTGTLIFAIYNMVTDFQRVNYLSTNGRAGLASVENIKLPRTSINHSFDSAIVDYRYTVRLPDGNNGEFTRSDHIKQDTQDALKSKTQADIFYLPENPQEAILALEVFDTPLDYVDLVKFPLLSLGLFILWLVISIKELPRHLRLKKLERNGAIVTGYVVALLRSQQRYADQYWLVYKFQSQKMRQRVSPQIYAGLHTGMSIQVRYMPEDKTISQAVFS